MSLYTRAFTDDKWPVAEVILRNIYEHEKFHGFSADPVIIDVGARISSFATQTCKVLQLNLDFNNCFYCDDYTASHGCPRG